MIMKPLTDRRWRGYTLDQLQAQRSINDARIMVQKIALQQELAALKTSRRNDKGGTFRKMLNALSYVDYAVLGISLARRVASIISHFRK